MPDRTIAELSRFIRGGENADLTTHHIGNRGGLFRNQARVNSCVIIPFPNYTGHFIDDGRFPAHRSTLPRRSRLNRGKRSHRRKHRDPSLHQILLLPGLQSVRRRARPGWPLNRLPARSSTPPGRCVPFGSKSKDYVTKSLVPRFTTARPARTLK